MSSLQPELANLGLKLEFVQKRTCVFSLNDPHLSERTFAYNSAQSKVIKVDYKYQSGQLMFSISCGGTIRDSLVLCQRGSTVGVLHIPSPS
jgi:hypothetical protein